MDFISSISFPNEPLISWTFFDHFCHHFWVGVTAKQQQTHPKMMTKMVKKCSTDQRFIRKRNTTYKIHTLVAIWKKWKKFRSSSDTCTKQYFSGNLKKEKKNSDLVQILVQNKISFRDPLTKNDQTYSLMNMKKLHISFTEAKTWHQIVCWFLCIYLFYQFLHDLLIKLFCRSK